MCFPPLYAHILQNRMRRPSQVPRCPHVLGNTYTPAYEAGNALRYAKCSLSKAPPIHLFNIWCSLLNCTKLPPIMPLFCKYKASTNAMSILWTAISKIKICIQATHCFDVGLFSCSALMHRGKGPETQFMSHLKPSFCETEIFLSFIILLLWSFLQCQQNYCLYQSKMVGFVIWHKYNFFQYKFQHISALRTVSLIFPYCLISVAFCLEGIQNWKNCVFGMSCKTLDT